MIKYPENRSDEDFHRCKPTFHFISTLMDAL